MPGSYGGFTSLFAWDANRNLFVNGTIYDNTNTSYYVKPSGTSVLSALTVGGKIGRAHV